MYVDDGIDYLTKASRTRSSQKLSFRERVTDSHCRSAFWKLRRRGSIDFSTMSVAAAVWMDDDEVVTRASLFLGAVGAAPMPVAEVAYCSGRQQDF